MSITLNDSDFQCLQDQLVDLKSKNYELAEKNRRSQADFEAAKAKICSLQLKLEEQERDFQVTSTTLRREIENVSSTRDFPGKENKEEDYKSRYKKLLHKAKELQQRCEKSVEILQQLDNQNKNLSEKLQILEEENNKLRQDLDAKNEELLMIEKKYEERLNDAIDCQTSTSDENQHVDGEMTVTNERDILKKQVEKLTAQLEQSKQRLESEVEERKIQERKGLQLVRELKRQLTLEKNRTDTLQKRIESLLSSASTITEPDVESRSRLSTSSSINGNGSSIGNGSRNNHDANSVGSWSFVPIKSASNPGANETLSICSIGSEDRETVQQPCDAKSEDSMQLVASPDSSPHQNLSDTVSSSSNRKESTSTSNRSESSRQNSTKLTYPSNNAIGDGMLIEEQAALMERLTNLQHDKWMLEEKLAYLESANSSLSEDLANKSDIIKNYFMDQASKTLSPSHNESSIVYNSSIPVARRTSFQGNVNHLISEKVSLKKVVDFLKERSQISSTESGSISREATKKMQIMLEETLIKCIKLQENLDYVTSELNKFKA